jgi:cyclophilin family peptidyl-prolyl cis-trans isomerase
MRNVFITILLVVTITAGGQISQGPVLSCRVMYIPDGIYATFNTNKGKFKVSLDYKKAPMTVANFIGLAEGTIKNISYPPGVPFFKGSIWHRVVPGHVIQGGEPSIVKDPANKEDSSTGYEIPNEITGLSHDKAGMLGMANGGPHTNTCQYYITLGDRSYLDGNYTLFGEVFEGMDVVNKIVQGDTTFSITVERKGDDATRFIVNDDTFKQLVDNQWKKVNHEKELKKEKEEKYISENYPGLTALPEGTRYKILNNVKGKAAAEGSVLTVSYTGKLTNGTRFVSTSDEGKPDFGSQAASFSYVQGKGKIIKGLEDVLKDMKPGEKRVVIIPPAQAYGDKSGFYGKSVPGQKRFVISPGETLILEVTLESFGK